MILPAIPFETFSAIRIKAKFHNGEDRPVKRGWELRSDCEDPHTLGCRFRTCWG
jgi:hypothetical protein